MNVRKDFCATCLSQGRQMFPLPFLDMKDFVHFYNDLKLCLLDKICWECRQFVLKMAYFKSKARKAQSNLADVSRKQHTSLQSLSRLKSLPGIALDITEQDLQEQTPNIPINPVKQETEVEFTGDVKNEPGDVKFEANETYNAADDHFEVFEHEIWKPTLVKPPEILLKPETNGDVTGVFQYKVSPPEIGEVVLDGNGIANATLTSLLNKKPNLLSNPPLLIEVPTLKLPILDPTLHSSEQKNHTPETSVEYKLEFSQDTEFDVEDQMPSFVESVKSASNEVANVVQDVNGIANATLMSLSTRKSNLTNPPLLIEVPTLKLPTLDPTLHTLKQESHIPEISVENIGGTSQEFITSQDQKPSYIVERLTEEERVKWWESKKEMKYKESIEVFRCEKCIELFFTRKTFLGHQKLHTEAYGHISCDICELKFNSENALLKHKGTHYKVSVMSIENLMPIGEPLERPLTEKRNRTWNQSGRSPSPASKRVCRANEIGSENLSTRKRVHQSLCVEQQPSVSTMEASLNEGDSAPSPAVNPSGSARPRRQLRDIEIAKYNTTSASAQPQRQLRDIEIADLLHYGSEEESDSDDDDDLVPPLLIPRTLRMVLETPEDQDEEIPNATPSIVSSSTSVGSSNNTPATQDSAADPDATLAAIPAASCATNTTPSIVSSPTSVVSSNNTPATQDSAADPDATLAAVPTAACATNTSSVVDNSRDANNASTVISTISTDGPVYCPNDFLDFLWEPFPDPPISPTERREPFIDTNCGPTVTLSDPYELFTAIWDREFMETIVIETNRYAQQMASEMMLKGELCPNSRIVEWKETSVDELYVYFAIILTMGVVIKSRIEDYWATDLDIFCTPGFRVQMYLRRFQLLNRCLHFNNCEGMYRRNLDPSKAKLFKVQPVISHLNNKFSTMYKMQQNIALDESLLQWKGWLGINQFIPNKAAAGGIRSYEICESQSGYLWRFIIHAHKPAPQAGPQPDPFAASTPALVLNLIKGLEYTGYTLWMDNFYNSPALARKLKSLGFDCVGTLRTNRQHVPRELTNMTKANMRPGQIVGRTSGDVDVMIWRDQNRVATISTYHGNAVSTVNEVEKPILMRDYNICMGGVDRKDQMLASYPIERKHTRVWYKKIFRRLLNVSVLNSYIIHRKTAAAKLTHRNFRKQLILSLLQKHAQPITSIQLPLPGNNSAIFEAKYHYPAEYPFLTTKNRHRHPCKVCRKRTHTYCVGCNKAVCAFKCFSALHT